MANIFSFSRLRASGNRSAVFVATVMLGACCTSTFGQTSQRFYWNRAVTPYGLWHNPYTPVIAEPPFLTRMRNSAIQEARAYREPSEGVLAAAAAELQFRRQTWRAERNRKLAWAERRRERKREDVIKRRQIFLKQVEKEINDAVARKIGDVNQKPD